MPSEIRTVKGCGPSEHYHQRIVGGNSVGQWITTVLRTFNGPNTDRLVQAFGPFSTEDYEALTGSDDQVADEVGDRVYGIDCLLEESGVEIYAKQGMSDDVEKRVHVAAAALAFALLDGNAKTN